ncbi:MAG TPA: nuclear transport factor 2 family protein [Bryobacteraceae bacterium]|nr:nuclear transport factor 2 family protein [Bryobacteraceae bacterium]
MKALIAVLAVFLASCGGTVGPAKTEDATVELKPLIEKLMADWSTLDPAKVAAYYAKEPGLPFYDIMPLKYSGWQEYEDGTKKVFSNWKALRLIAGPDLKAYKNGNIAWVTFTFTFEVTPNTGDVMKGEGRNTQVLEKRGNDWLIVHEHVSVPMADAPPPPPPPSKKK